MANNRRVVIDDRAARVIEKMSHEGHAELMQEVRRWVAEGDVYHIMTQEAVVAFAALILDEGAQSGHDGETEPKTGGSHDTQSALAYTAG